MFKAENRFSYWDVGGKKGFRSGVAPGEHLVSETGVTCFSHTEAEAGQMSDTWLHSHNQAQDCAATEAAGYFKSCPWPAGVYDTDISAPSDTAECPASFHSEAEMCPRNDCQFEIVLLIKLTELSDRVCEDFLMQLKGWLKFVFSFTQGICSREFFSLARAGSFKIYFFIHVL